MPGPVELKPIKTQDVIVPIIVIQSLICHAFSERNIEMIESKQQKRATGSKPARQPEHEAEASLYYTLDGKPGFPAIGFRQAMISACRYVDGLPMTIARGAFFVLGDASSIELVDDDDDYSASSLDAVTDGERTVDRARQELVDWQRRYSQVYEVRPALPWVREALGALGSLVRLKTAGL